MGFKPLINFRGTTMARAFILNAILVGITTALTIEIRKIIDENKEDIEERKRESIAHNTAIEIALR